MNSHASRRVVLELPQRHPLANASALWKHFWNLDRPVDPTPHDLMTVIEDIGYAPHLEMWIGSMRQESNLEQMAHYSRIRLCLPESKENEVLEFLRSQPLTTTRDLATIWWDKQ